MKTRTLLTLVSIGALISIVLINDPATKVEISFVVIVLWMIAAALGLLWD